MGKRLRSDLKLAKLAKLEMFRAAFARGVLCSCLIETSSVFGRFTFGKTSRLHSWTQGRMESFDIDKNSFNYAMSERLFERQRKIIPTPSVFSPCFRELEVCDIGGEGWRHPKAPGATALVS